MRTPGDDASLAVGFLFTEGIIQSRDQIAEVRHCGKPSPDKGIRNTVLVELTDGVEVDLKRLERHFYTTSSCGVCGKSSIEALQTGVVQITNEGRLVSADVIHRLPAAIISRQSTFERTDGLHASMLFNTAGEIDSVSMAHVR